jgi:hypothetical protein
MGLAFQVHISFQTKDPREGVEGLTILRRRSGEEAKGVSKWEAK